MAKIPKCKICDSEFQKYKSTDTCCSHSCQTIYNRQKLEAKEAKEWSVTKKEMEEKLKSLGDYKADLEKEVNAIVRLLDRDCDCISGSWKAGTYVVHAGHYLSVGAFPAIRFNLLNIYAQSEKDNLHLHGNGAIYALRLIEVFGQDVANEINGLRLKYPELKASIPEIKEATLIARQIKKSLIKMDTTFSTEERIDLRRTYNKMIGLYL